MLSNQAKKESQPPLPLYHNRYCFLRIPCWPTRLSHITALCTQTSESGSRLYLFDTGVCRALSRTLNVPLNPGTYAFGRAFEHFVVIEALRRNDYLRKDFRFSYLRTKDGAEVDLVKERPGQLGLRPGYWSFGSLRSRH